MEQTQIKVLDYIYQRQENLNVYYSPSKKFLFVKNARCASTSLVQAFNQNIQDFGFLKQDCDIDINDTFTLTSVRNPFDRVLSLWQWFKGANKMPYSIDKFVLEMFPSHDP